MTLLQERHEVTYFKLILTQYTNHSPTKKQAYKK